MNEKEYTLRSIFFICGAIEKNNGNLFTGGCGKEVSAWEGYRCSDCTATFHRNCIRKHFDKSKTTDN
jgi:hypothetical protein